MVKARSAKLVNISKLPNCPAARLSYAALADCVRILTNPYLASTDHATPEQEREWLYSAEYGKSVQLRGGCSYKFCCSSLDINPEMFRKVMRYVTKHNKNRDLYIKNLISDLYSYNNIYYRK